jgi:hypothetical protein
MVLDENRLEFRFWDPNYLKPNFWATGGGQSLL